MTEVISRENDAGNRLVVSGITCFLLRKNNIFRKITIDLIIKIDYIVIIS
jgi:hypothetical protein